MLTAVYRDGKKKKKSMVKTKMQKYHTLTFKLYSDLLQAWKKETLTALDSQQRELARGRKVETASVKQDCLGIAIVLTASKFIFVIFALPDTGQ